MELSDLTKYTLDITEDFMAELRRRMTPGAGLGAIPLEAMDTKELQTISGLITKVARVMPGLIKEMRALIKDAKAAGEALSLEDRRKLIVEFASMMPVEHQALLRQELCTQLGWE